MKVYCISEFVKELEKLQGNNSYNQILSDVCDYLADKDILELHQIKDILKKTEGVYSLNKYRVANSQISKGKSASYRCICVCLPKIDAIYLGYIYPKTGAEGKDNLKKDDYKRIASAIQKAMQNDNLYELDIKSKTYQKKDKKS